MGWEFKRFAAYYAPRPDSPLGQFGAAWLGWDPDAGAEVASQEPGCLPRRRADLVAAPRDYGFHGTLKAPFRLAGGADPEVLDRTLRDLATEWAPFHFTLELAEIDGFLALVPSGDALELNAIAAACVKRLDIFRALATSAEIARRDPARLIGREAEYLAAWGYPYVFEHFRFHLTLTGALPPSERVATRRVLELELAPILAEPLAFEDLCLFGEAADGRFHVVSRHRLGVASARD